MSTMKGKNVFMLFVTASLVFRIVPDMEKNLC